MTLDSSPTPMNGSLLSHLAAFGRLRVLVLGEAMLDTYLEGEASRLCPEAPAPVVSVSRRRDGPGGAANTAVNVAALGASVSFLSVIGDDAEGRALRLALERQGVAAEHLLVEPGRRTLSKNRVGAAGQILARFDDGDTRSIGADAEAALVDRINHLFPRCDAVVISDYGYGLMTPAVLAALTRLKVRDPRVVVGDSKRLPAYRPAGLTAVKPNYTEAMQLLGLDQHAPGGNRAERLLPLGGRLLEITGARIVAVTLDHEGAVLFEIGQPVRHVPAQAGPCVCTSGAGDTWSAALALALAGGAATREAAEIASAAAGVVVAKEGTATCTSAELRAALGSERSSWCRRAWLAAELEQCRRRGQRIVFTNGCFDILHRGHVNCLRRARELGDVLVVGVNSDASVRRLKGPTRPINCLEDRLAVLSALRCVDYLIPFDEDNPQELIRLVRPHAFVKGGDYTRETLPEAGLVEALGGVVHIFPLVEQRSTTRVIERIRSATRPGALVQTNGIAAP